VDRPERVADQDDVLIAPAPVAHHDEIDPDRFVRQQRMAAQVVFEEILAIAAALFVGHRFKAGFDPGGRVALDDERAGVLAVAVRMGDKDAVPVLAKDQRQRVEPLLRPVPDIFIRPHIERRLKVRAVFLPHDAVDAVGADDKVTVGKVRGIGDAGLKAKPYAGLPAVFL